jgi:predicted Ser/Thr protein kinase
MADHPASRPPEPPTNLAVLPEAAASLRAGTVPPQLPARFGRYRLEKLLGKGGMGSVYLAHDTQLDRKVALKVPTFGPDDDGLRERFFREARAAATLHHPNLCPVHDVGELDGVHFLTMAFIDGKPLSAYVRPDKPLPPAQAVPLVRILAKALQEAHDQGIIHRDLKPANVMIGKKKQPVVMDFGLARRSASQDERLTHSGAIMGTPAYMAPEQVNGDVAAMGPCTDVYALGVMLYELLTGKRPFEGAMGTLMARILHDPPPPPTKVRPDLDPALGAICLKALAKQSQDRYPSMKAFAAALERWQAGKPAAPAAVEEIPTAAMDPEPQALAPTVAAVTAVPTRRPTLVPKKMKTRGRGWRLTQGQKWVLLAGGIFFFACAMPLGLIAYLFRQAMGEVSQVVAKGSQWLDEQEKEQKRLREEQKQEQQQWEGLARSWQPPPKDIDPARLFPSAVGAFRLEETGEQATIPDLPTVPLHGRRAVYRGPAGAVELFAYRASKIEKEMVFRKQQEELLRQGGIPNLVPGGLNFRGTPEGTYLVYERGPKSGAPEQYGLFWWDRDWLFLARGSDAKAPSALLRDYLATFGTRPSGGTGTAAKP